MSTEAPTQPSVDAPAPQLTSADIAALRNLVAAVPLFLVEPTHSAFLRDRFLSRPVSRSRSDEKRGPESVTRFENAKQTGGYGYPVDANGIAVVKINGAITPEQWAWYDEAETISDWIVRDAKAMAADPKVKGVLFMNDSPGGYVAGSFEMHDAIAALSAVKRTATLAGSYCCSASYLQAVATQHITAFRTSIVGSIGTRSAVIDASALFAKIGAKMIPIDSGGMKSAGLIGTEITPEQIEYFRGTVRALQSVFTDAVAKGRRMSLEQATAMADGRVHVAADARAMGLIDAVGSIEEAYGRLHQSKEATTNRPKADAAAGQASEPTAEAAAGDGPPSDGAEAQQTGDDTPEKGSDMGQTNTPTAPTQSATEPKPASIAELQAAFPKDPAFALEAAKQALTLTEAKAAYADKLMAENDQLREQVAKQSTTAPAGATSHGVKPVATKPAESQGSSTAGDAVANFNAAVEEQMAKPGFNGGRKGAVMAVAKRDPAGHRAYLEATNPKRKQRDMLADKYDG